MVLQPYEDHSDYELYRHHYDILVELLLEGGANPKIKNRVSTADRKSYESYLVYKSKSMIA